MTPWQQLTFEIEKSCLKNPSNKTVTEEMKKLLVPGTLLYQQTFEQIWNTGLSAIVSRIRGAQRSDLKTTVITDHISKGGTCITKRTSAPFARSSVVGPAARVATHSGIAVNKFKHAWDMVFFGKFVKDMTWEDLDRLEEWASNRVIAAAEIGHYAKELKTKLKRGTGKTVKNVWKRSASDKLFALSVTHANTVVKSAV